MKFLCDVHISYKLVSLLKTLGCDAIHVNDILDKWATKDSDICIYADKHDLTVITKDADFRDSHFIHQTPKKLIKINLGNIPTNELLSLFKKNFNDILKLNNKQLFLIELDNDLASLIE